jgi:hypothetical protein
MTLYTFDIIESDVTVNFTGALAQDAKADEDINMPTDYKTCTINKLEIREIAIQSKQNLEWDLILWSKTSKDNVALNTDTYITKINFPVGSGKQIAGANQWYYEQYNLKIDYNDSNNLSQIHCSLVNRSVTSKNAGVTGQVKIRFVAVPGI